jgi:hypothetical protein
VTKLLVTKQTAKFTLNALLIVSSLGAVSGAIDCWRNPQEITPQQLNQVQLAYEGKGEMPMKDKHPILIGFIKMGVSVGAMIPLVLMRSEVDAIDKPLAKPSNQKRGQLATATIPQEEWGEDDKIDPAVPIERQLPAHRKPEFISQHAVAARELNLFINENEWIMKCLKAKAIVFVGKGSSGKSRTAMCIAILQRFFHGQSGAELKILDPDAALNGQYKTWISGTLYTGDMIADTQKTVLREEGSTRWLTTIMDEFSGWSDRHLAKYAKDVVDHTVRIARKTNQCHMILVHGLEKGMFAGEDVGSGWTKKLLDSSMVIHFVLNEDKFGTPQKANVVWVQYPSQNYITLNDEYATYNKGWERFNLPEKLDPAYFEEQLGGYMEQMGWGLKIATKAVVAEEVKELAPALPDVFSAEMLDSAHPVVQNSELAPST